jgi:eukaryotic-like serine/threonine-protein kinase
MADQPRPDKSIFLAAIEIGPAAERAEFVDRSCAGDPALRARVAALLAAHDNPPQLLEVPEETAPAGDGAGPPDPPGTVIGPYKLLQQIGEGGMGVVYMAEQMHPVRRQVALKLIKAGLDGHQVAARFEAERQALALMDHVNIARVLDAGETPPAHAGGPPRPYFVMELVRGVPITKYCDDHHLTPRQRLELFVPVCRAVQHAHQKGIIHRDLKPSNVLVTLSEGRPVPKVIDFGVAKATEQKLTDRTLFTQCGTLVGTVEYMSPEQAEMSPLGIDTRSDIYSLGVLLYELLTGSTPLTHKRLKEAAFGEILRLIREEEPPRPSIRLSDSGEALASISARRHTEPAKLTRLVRGELDWIVMKALEKDRTRRYETANGFGQDVERYLADEPVQACPPSARYRLRKFARRNWGPVIAASLVFLALLVGIAGTTAGLVRANRAVESERLAKWEAEEQRRTALRAAEREAGERQTAEAAKVEAQAKEAEANAIVQFFEERVLAAGRPKWKDGGLGHDVSLRDAVRASLPALGTSFKDQPLVEARLRHSLGTTFQYLGDPTSAAEQSEKARALLTRHLGPEHPKTLRSVNNLAVSYADLSRPAEALKLREEVLAAQKRVLPPDHLDVLMSMHNLASSYADMDRPAEALKLREEVLAALKRVLLPDHPDTLRGMHNLAASYADLNRPAEALKLREELLAARRRVLPPDHPDILMSMHNLANSYADMGRPAAALKLREEVLAARKRVFPPDHPDTLASMHNLANSYADLNRPAEALKLREEVLAARRRVLRPDHPDTLRSMNNLAASYAEQNRHGEAVKLYEETLAARRRVLPPDHPDTLWSMYNLALGYANLNRPAEALRLIDDALARVSRQCPDPTTLPSLVELRLQCYGKAGDVSGCRATAEILERMNPTGVRNLYEAACCRAVTAALQAKVPGADAGRLAREDADKAMAWLTKAVEAGWTDAALTREDTDLDFLRDREDFKRLLAGLEGKAAPKPEPSPPPRSEN